MSESDHHGFVLSAVFLREKLPVHVVVDPILSKVLRPHQREVNESQREGVGAGG